MSRLAVAASAIVSAILLESCASHGAAPAAPCCAAPGFSRVQIEAVLGAPGVADTAQWKKPPSPPPDAPIYTTEDGWLTVHYAGRNGLAMRLSLELFEPKTPDETFEIASRYLPRDADDTGSRVTGPTRSIRVYRSASLAAKLAASHGLLYVECSGPQPARYCSTVDVALGSP